MWQMLVIIAQMSLGMALLLLGLRFAAQFLVAVRVPRHRERIEERTGRPLKNPGAKLALSLAAAAIGGILLATIDRTADSLPHRPLEEWEK